MRDLRQELKFRPVVLQAWLSVNGTSSEIQVRDMGVDGICFSQTTPLRPGQQCRVKLTLDLGPGRTSEPLELPVRVAWSTAVDDRVQIGAAFLPLLPEQRQALEGLIFLLTRDVAEDQGGSWLFAPACTRRLVARAKAEPEGQRPAPERPLCPELEDKRAIG